MTESEALPIIADLAEGTDPITGQALPVDSPYRHPDIVRALHVAAEALDRAEQRQQREQALPPQAGRPWTQAEDQQLCMAFDAKTSIDQLARSHNRTAGAIKSRLAKLGKMVPHMQTHA